MPVYTLAGWPEIIRIHSVLASNPQAPKMETPFPTKTSHKTAYPAISPTRPELTAKGKTIVITGGGTGIGAETALYFAKAGAAWYRHPRTQA
jgi:hypothetical protein